MYRTDEWLLSRNICHKYVKRDVKNRKETYKYDMHVYTTGCIGHINGPSAKISATNMSKEIDVY